MSQRYQPKQRNDNCGGIRGPWAHSHRL